jgi:hypothetical protein
MKERYMVEETTKEYQIEREFEMIKLGLQVKQNLTVNLRIASIEFKREIEELTQAILVWRKADRFRGRERKAYSSLLDTLPAQVLAENIIYSILEAYLRKDEGTPLTFQHVVTNALILSRFKAILPKEETAIPHQFKFKIVDMMVTRSVYLLSAMFTIKQAYQEMASIELTARAKSRLADVDTRSLLFDGPMHCKPAEWVSVFNGGYLTPEMQKTAPLIRSLQHDFKELVAIDRSLQANPEILQSVNKMQNVCFKIDDNYEQYHKTVDNFRVSAIKKVETNLTRLKAEILKLEQELKEAETSTTEET